MFSDETLRITGNKNYPCACNEGTGYSGNLAPQILNLGTTWDSSLASSPSCFTCGDRVPTTHYIRGFVEPTVSPNALAKRKSLYSAANRTIPRLPTAQSL